MPQDVHDKQFKLVRQTTGYDMDEVDAFLDEVEFEIARLSTVVAELQAAQAAAPPSNSPAPATPEQNAMAAARILELAQRTADEHVAEATRAGEQIVSEARSRAEAVVASLESRRIDLESRVSRLRAFEVDIRTRLRGYLETQLRELDASEPAAQDEAGAPEMVAERQPQEQY